MKIIIWIVVSLYSLIGLLKILSNFSSFIEGIYFTIQNYDPLRQIYLSEAWYIIAFFAGLTAYRLYYRRAPARTAGAKQSMRDAAKRNGIIGFIAIAISFNYVFPFVPEWLLPGMWAVVRDIATAMSLIVGYWYLGKSEGQYRATR